MVRLKNDSKAESEEALKKYRDILVKISRIGGNDEDFNVAELEGLEGYLESNWVIFIEDMNELSNGVDYPIGDIYNEIFEAFFEDEQYYILVYCPSIMISVVIPKAIVKDNLEFNRFISNNSMLENLDNR